MKYTYYFDVFDMSYYDIGAAEINVGDEVLVYCKTNIMTGAEKWGFRKDFAAEGGYPGNMDSHIRRYHGWRGTTNDSSVHAMGVYTVKSVEHIKGKYEAKMKVVLNRTDIRKGED